MYDIKKSLWKTLAAILVVLFSVLITALPVLLPSIAQLKIADLIAQLLEKIIPGLGVMTVVGLLTFIRDWLKHRNP